MKQSYHQCEFPGCENDSFNCRMNRHHVQPKSKGGNNHKSNIMYFCPTCHSKIFVADTKGIHGSLIKGSIEIINRLTSTAGKVLQYIDCDNMQMYLYNYCTNSKDEFN